MQSLNAANMEAVLDEAAQIIPSRCQITAALIILGNVNTNEIKIKALPDVDTAIQLAERVLEELKAQQARPHKPKLIGVS